MTGKELKAAREELGLSIDELADALGVNARTIYRLEDSDKVPTRYVLALQAILTAATEPSEN